MYIDLVNCYSNFFFFFFFAELLNCQLRRYRKNKTTIPAANNPHCEVMIFRRKFITTIEI